MNPVLLLFTLTAMPEQPRVWMGAYMEDGERCAGVAAVVKGSPADRAGVQPGDCVAKIDGRKTALIQDVIDALRGLDAGTAIVLETSTAAARARRWWWSGPRISSCWSSSACRGMGRRWASRRRRR